MPIYEYRRPDGTTFELQQPFSAEALTVDPDTGVPVERVLHPPALHFKGNGFYNTDYGTRKRERETAANAASSSSKDSSSKDSASKDASSKDSSSKDSASKGSSSKDGAGEGSTGGKAKGGEQGSGRSRRSKPARPVAAKG